MSGKDTQHEERSGISRWLLLVLLVPMVLIWWSRREPPPHPEQKVQRDIGVLTIATYPPGARVLVDGVERCPRSPCTLRRLNIDTALRISAKLPGQTSGVKVVTLTATSYSQSVKLYLSPDPKARFDVRVRSVPPGAIVRIPDLGEQAKLPTVLQMARHTLPLTVEVSKTGYRTKTVVIGSAKGDPPSVVTVELERPR